METVDTNRVKRGAFVYQLMGFLWVHSLSPEEAYELLNCFEKWRFRSNG